MQLENESSLSQTPGRDDVHSKTTGRGRSRHSGSTGRGGGRRSWHRRASRPVSFWLVTLLVVALITSRLRKPVVDELSRLRRLLAMARVGLDVLRSPARMALAIFFQCLGWLFQLLAVWIAMRAFAPEHRHFVTGHCQRCVDHLQCRIVVHQT